MLVVEAGLEWSSGRLLRIMRSGKEQRPAPDFMVVPVREGELGSANIETIRNLVEPILPALRELRRLNWEIRLVRK